MLHFKKILPYLTLSLLLGLIILPNLLQAAETTISNASVANVMISLNTIAGTTGLNVITKDTLVTKVGAFLKTVFGYLGALFLILVIYAGFLWMTAGGNEDNIKKGKNIITWAVLGLAVIAAAYTITATVLSIIK
ncbi:MAG: hypothetical protein WCW02_03355 [Candidatus Buchananbacteria bacterium]